MPRIPEPEIERIKNEIDLAALVRSKGIELKRHGSKDLVALSPFTEEKTPSFIVTPAKNLWHCMSSGKGGSVIDFVMEYEGVSFRHAFELLAEGDTKALMREGERVITSTVPKLAAPVTLDADDQTLLAQVVDYYHERLAKSPAALDYLKTRGLDDEELLKRFRVGFADRTLGLRLPQKNRVAGASLRKQLAKLGVYRATSGHEHFNGCIVVPVLTAEGQIGELYGRRIDPRAPKPKRHLYMPGPHRGVFNTEALGNREIILAESILDAMTFIRHGMEATTCTFGNEGFTDELFEAIRAAGVETVRLAYDADDAGDRAAERDALRLQAAGIECYRVTFPLDHDANAYALDAGAAALKKAVRSAVWIGTKSKPPSLAAKVNGNGSSNGAAKKKRLELEQRGEHHHAELDGRAYRIGGLGKNGSLEVMKITLRLVAGELMHLDQLDLCRDTERRRFIERAAEECRLEKATIKRDLSQLLLACERAQEERLAAPAQAAAAEVRLNPDEEKAAKAFAKAPNLMKRIGKALSGCGLIGEKNNGLAIYLACASRLLAKPLAVMIQSTSAAGKTTLMEAVLDLFPAEEKVKYSAMTGQSLYYMAEASLKNKILAIVEEEGAEKASYALKLLQSEGELRIASTGKDPHTGRMETQTYHVEGPAAIVLTTTSVDIDEELMNRCLVLSVDESREQTRAIQKAQREAETPEGIVAAEERADTLTLLQNLQRLLKPMKVANPFAPQLTFTDERTRTRRDHTKYLALIKAIALLHQFQRKTITRKTASGREVEMLPITIEDIEAANAIAPEVLGRGLDELPPQTRRLLEAVKAMVRERPKNAKSFTRREVREETGWSATQVRVHLERLVELEYVATRYTRAGAAFPYELLIDADKPQGVAHIGLIDPKKLKPTPRG